MSRVYELTLDTSKLDRNIDTLIARNRLIFSSLQKLSDTNSKAYKDASTEILKLSNNTKTLDQALEDLRKEYSLNQKEIKGFRDELSRTGTEADKIADLRTEVAKLKKEVVELNAENKKLGNSLTSATKQATEFETKYVKALNRVNGQAGTLNKTFNGITSSILGAFGIERLFDKVGEALRFAVQAGADFEKQIDAVGAISRASSEELNKLSDQAIDLGSRTSLTARQAAEAQGILAQAGFTVNEILQATPSVLALAESANISLAEAADIAASALRAYGIEAANLEDVNNLLARSVTSANLTTQDFGAAFKFAAPLANNLGIAIEDTAAIINSFANAGLRGTVGGTAFRAILTSLVKQSNPAKAALKSLGVETFDASGNLLDFVDILRQLEDAYPTTTQLAEIFGKNAGAVSILLNQGADSLKQYSDSLGNVGAIVEGTQEIFESYGLSFTRLDRTNRELSSSIASTVRDLGDSLTALEVDESQISTLFQLLLPSVEDVDVAREQINGFFNAISEPTDQQAAAFEAYGVELANAAGNGFRPFQEILSDIVTATAEETQSQIAAVFGEDVASIIEVTRTQNIVVNEGTLEDLGVAQLSDQQRRKLEERLGFTLQVGVELDGDQVIALLAEQLGELNTAQEIAAQRLENLSGSFTILLSALEGLAIRVFISISGELDTFVQAITSGVTRVNQLLDGQLSLANFLGIDESTTDKTVVAISLVAASLAALTTSYTLAAARSVLFRTSQLLLGPVMKLLSIDIGRNSVLWDFNTAAVTRNQAANSNYVKGITKVGAAQKIYNGILKVFNLLLAANPIGLIIIGLAALAAAVVVAYNRFEEVRIAVAGVLAAVQFLWERARPLISALGELIKTSIGIELELLKVAFQVLFSVVRTVFRGIYRIVEVTINAIEEIFQGLNSFVTLIFNSIRKTISDTWDVVVRLTRDFTASLLELFGFTQEEIQFIFSDVETFFSDLWDSIVDNTVGRFDGLLLYLSTRVSQVLTGIKEAFENAFGIDLDPVITKFGELFNAIEKAGKFAKKFFEEDLVDGLKGAFGDGTEAQKNIELIGERVRLEIEKIDALEANPKINVLTLDEERDDLNNSLARILDNAVRGQLIDQATADDFYNKTIGRLGSTIDNRFDSEIRGEFEKITASTADAIPRLRSIVDRVRDTAGDLSIDSDDLLSDKVFDALIRDLEAKIREIQKVTNGGTGSGSGTGSTTEETVNKLEREADKLLAKQLELQFEQVEVLRQTRVQALVSQEEFQELTTEQQQVLLEKENTEIQKIRERLIKKEVQEIKEFNRLRNEANQDSVTDTFVQLDALLARQRRFLEFERDLERTDLINDFQEELNRELRLLSRELEAAGESQEDIATRLQEFRENQSATFREVLQEFDNITQQQLDDLSLINTFDTTLNTDLGFDLLAANLQTSTAAAIQAINTLVSQRQAVEAEITRLEGLETLTDEQSVVLNNLRVLQEDLVLEETNIRQQAIDQVEQTQEIFDEVAENNIISYKLEVDPVIDEVEITIDNVAQVDDAAIRAAVDDLLSNLLLDEVEVPIDASLIPDDTIDAIRELAENGDLVLTLEGLRELLSLPEAVFNAPNAEVVANLEEYNTALDDANTATSNLINTLSSTGELVDNTALTETVNALQAPANVGELDDLDLTRSLVERRENVQLEIEELNENREVLVKEYQEAREAVDEAAANFDEIQKGLFNQDEQESAQQILDVRVERLIEAESKLQNVRNEIQTLSVELSEASEEDIQNNLETNLQEIEEGFDAAALAYDKQLEILRKRFAGRDFETDTEVSQSFTVLFDGFATNVEKNIDEGIEAIDTATRNQREALAQSLAINQQELEQQLADGVITPSQFIQQNQILISSQLQEERALIESSSRSIVTFLEQQETRFEQFIERRRLSLIENSAGLSDQQLQAELEALAKLEADTIEQINDDRLKASAKVLNQIELQETANANARINIINDLVRRGVIKERDAAIERQNIQNETERLFLAAQLKFLETLLSTVDVTDAAYDKIREQIKNIKKEINDIPVDTNPRSLLDKLLDGIDDLQSSPEFGALQDAFSNFSDSVFSELENDIQRQIDLINEEKELVDIRLEQEKELANLQKDVADQKANARNQTEAELERELEINEITNKKEIQAAEVKAAKQTQILDDQLSDQEAREEQLGKVRERLAAAQAASESILLGLKSAQLAINLLNAPAEAAIGSGPLAPIAIAATVLALGAAALQVKRIFDTFKPEPTQIFEDGGEIREGQRAGSGGLLRGRRHKQGGILIEAEDEEYVLNREAVRLFRPTIEFMNQQGLKKRKGLKHNNVIPEEVRMQQVRAYTPFKVRRPTMRSQGIARAEDGGQIISSDGTSMITVKPDNTEVVNAINDLSNSLGNQKVVLSVSELEELLDRRAELRTRDV